MSLGVFKNEIGRRSEPVWLGTGKRATEAVMRRANVSATGLVRLGGGEFGAGRFGEKDCIKVG